MSCSGFVVLSTQRSGSTWVIDSLNSHPEIVCHGELLLQDGQGCPPFGAGTLPFWEEYCRELHGRDKLHQDKLLFEYLREMLESARPARATGFKLMYGQAGAYPDVWRFFRKNKFRVIHLVRENYLDVLVSRQLAYERDLYHYDGRQALDESHVEIHASSLLKKLRENQRKVAQMQGLVEREELQALNVSYEQLQKGSDGFQRMLEFLNVSAPSRSLQSTLRKINRRPKAEVISNYNSVSETLSGTEFEHMLD